MITIEPLHWYKWDFAVTREDRALAHFDLSSWRERGVITIGDRAHQVYRKGLNGDFVIEHGGRVLARATKPSVFRKMFLIRIDGKEYTLRKPSIWRRTFALMDGDRQIGTLSAKSPWSYGATADFPDNWPAEITAFVIWLVMLLWKRDAEAA